MNRFQIFLLFALLIPLFAPRTHAIRRSFPSPSSARSQQVFRPSMTSAPYTKDQARDFVSEERRVPTGSNPLHNKR
ncbi:hypothetical protein D8674_035887 [Pyrus ussuriensis x Pyrus communis]|uniref:Uncharacterized protein n=1 Tax=Pyrus ussuriensis x Pyrus communis TaxID=2448454 RepID=A0A5N5GIA7_9ROSA|nr:hypothetical protein D8674_035887 [Pyrus ussuriensis x Pyrus communis]